MTLDRAFASAMRRMETQMIAAICRNSELWAWCVIGSREHSLEIIGGQAAYDRHWELEGPHA